MSARRLLFTANAFDELWSLHIDQALAILDAVERHIETGSPKAKRLVGKPPVYRIRVGVFRVMYEYDLDEFVVTAVRRRNEATYR